MKEIQIEIEGVSPLLMNRFSIEERLERDKGTRTTKSYDHKEEAKKSAYWSKDEVSLMIPSMNLYKCILDASSFFKISKRSATAILAGSLRITPDEILLNTKKYEVDIRSVVIQRARVLKARARIDKWKATFTITYNDKLIGDSKIIKDVLEEAGQRIGLMDFRPTKKGFYGCFKVNKFEISK